MIKWFDSIAALRAEAIARKCTKGHRNNAKASWCGETEAQTLARARQQGRPRDAYYIRRKHEYTGDVADG